MRGEDGVTKSNQHAEHGAAGFLWEFIKAPFQIGAIAPSSPALARQMLDGEPIADAQVVLEYGPGTGSFTDELSARLGEHTRYAGIELNAHMVSRFRLRHSDKAIHHASVADADRVCEAEGLPGEGAVDYIVSGLPWASFPRSLQTSILSTAIKVLKPGGKLITFGYHVGLCLPAGWRFYSMIHDYFDTIEKSRWVWNNLPPAFVITCTKGGEVKV